MWMILLHKRGWVETIRDWLEIFSEEEHSESLTTVLRVKLNTLKRFSYYNKPHHLIILDFKFIENLGILISIQLRFTNTNR